MGTTQRSCVNSVSWYCWAFYQHSPVDLLAKGNLPLSGDFVTLTETARLNIWIVLLLTWLSWELHFPESPSLCGYCFELTNGRPCSKCGRQKGSTGHPFLQVFFTGRYSESPNQREACQSSGQTPWGPFDPFCVPSPSFRVVLFPKAHTCKSSLEACSRL